MIGDSVDSGLEAEPAERLSNYLLIQAKDRLELTVTPAALRTMERLRASFSLDPVNNNLGSPYPPLSVNNNLGPGTTAVLTTKAEVSIYTPRGERLSVLPGTSCLQFKNEEPVPQM